MHNLLIQEQLAWLGVLNKVIFQLKREGKGTIIWWCWNYWDLNASALQKYERFVLTCKIIQGKSIQMILLSRDRSLVMVIPYHPCENQHIFCHFAWSILLKMPLDSVVSLPIDWQEFPNPSHTFSYTKRRKNPFVIGSRKLVSMVYFPLVKFILANSCLSDIGLSELQLLVFFCCCTSVFSFSWFTSLMKFLGVAWLRAYRFCYFGIRQLHIVNFQFTIWLFQIKECAMTRWFSFCSSGGQMGLGPVLQQYHFYFVFFFKVRN
jgi:hypothetical protein